MNRLVSLLVLICLTSFVQAGNPSQGAAVHTLVIDPGHGGMDPGAIGPGGHHEADLALAVSLKFGEMVKEAFPDVKIIYTRTTDKFVSLADRADMANKAKADLFICIHLNSATNHDAYGTSTYVLGLHRTDDNLEIAKRENAVIDLEINKDKKYDFDPNSPEGHIIMSMKQNAFLDQSILIASKIEDELAQLSKRKSRGVKQAGFWVLYKTAMPSLLAEIGFISNPTEEQYLSSDAGQTNIATSVYKAFRVYKNEIEGRKDTEVVAKAPVATPEKKKELLAEAPPQPQSKPAQSNPNPDKPQQEPEAKLPEVKVQQQPTIKPNPQEAKKEEKAWEPDTTFAEPAPIAIRESPVVKPSTQDKPVVKTEPEPTSVDGMTKKLVPVRTANEPAPKKEEPKPVAKKEEPKPAVKEVKEETKAVAKKEEPKPAAKAVKEEPKPVAKKEDPKPVTPKVVKEETKVVARKETPKPAVKEPVKAAADTTKKKPATTTAKATDPKTIKPATTQAKADSVKAAAKKDVSWAKTTNAKEPTPAKATPKKETPAPAVNPASDNVIFTVQILAAHRAPKNYDDLVATFGLINREDIGDGVIRYMAGQFTHYKEAEKTLALAKAKGFPTAFIICYQDNVRLDGKKTHEVGLKHP